MADIFTEALQKSKAIDRMMDSFINKEQTAQDSLQLDELEKGKAGQIGEIRTWGGKKYQKTAKGWRPVKKSTQESSPSEENKEEKSLKADNDWAKTIREYTACGGGNFGKVLEKKPNGDLLVEYIRRGEKPWTDVAKKGSEDWKHLKDEKPSMQKESSDKYEFVLRGKVDPVNDKDWEKVASEIDWRHTDASQIGQTVVYMGKVDDSDHPYAVKYYSPNGKNSDVMRLTEADYKRNLERDRKLQADLDQRVKERSEVEKTSGGWKEGFGGGTIWKEFPDADFKVIEIKEGEDGKYRINVGGYKAPNAITESEAVEKKLSEIRSQVYDSLKEAKMMADKVSQMKYSDIVKEASDQKKSSDRSTAVGTRLAKYEEDLNAQIKDLQEKLKKAKEASEKASKVEDLLPGILKGLGMEVSKTTYVLNEDNIEKPRFVIEAKPLKKLRVKDDHYASRNSRDKAYERALAKAGVLSSSIQFAFKEKGFDVTASFNPYDLMYEKESEINEDITVDVFVK